MSITHNDECYKIHFACAIAEVERLRAELEKTQPVTRPMISAPIGPTKPQAGVIATRPATAPEAAPSIEGLPLANHSVKDQESVAAAVAISVLMKAIVVTPLASRLEPALKPNQPTHSSDAPIIVITRECGAIASRP